MEPSLSVSVDTEVQLEGSSELFEGDSPEGENESAPEDRVIEMGDDEEGEVVESSEESVASAGESRPPPAVYTPVR